MAPFTGKENKDKGGKVAADNKLGDEVLTEQEGAAFLGAGRQDATVMFALALRGWGEEQRVMGREMAYVQMSGTGRK